MKTLQTPVQAGEPLFNAQALRKHFDGVPVLQGLALQVHAGEVHALVGENGSGKSTAMNLIAGLLQPDGGRMRLGGRPWQPRTAAQARAGGVAFVQQELNLFLGLSLADNLFLLQPPPGCPRWPSARRRHRLQQARTHLAQVGLTLDPATPCGQLTTGERQLLEVAKALAARPRLVIFDEPTTSLSQPERERLFGLIRQLRDEGCGVLYISHVLADVFHLADRLTLLRDGLPVATLLPGQMQAERVIAAISARRGATGDDGRPTALPGADLAPPASRLQAAPPAGQTQRAPLLQVRGLTRHGVVHGVSFDLQAGEVLGLAGLMGAGRSELARLVFGLDRWEAGEVRLQGCALRPGHLADRLAAGLALLGEDRQREGLMPHASVQSNMALAALPRFCRGPLRWLRQGMLARSTREMAGTVALQASSPGFMQAAVRRLSGGNQQKALLGRWALRAPRLWILDEPTRGVDVNARADIHCWIRDQAAQGAGVLVISSEQDELTQLCDRILVLRHGHRVAEFSRQEFDPGRILAASMQAPQVLQAPPEEAAAPRPGHAASPSPSGTTAQDRRPGAPEGRRPVGPRLRGLLQQAARPALAPVWALLLAAAVFGSLSPRFLTVQNLVNISLQATPLAVLALGMHWVLLAGSIDLSVAAVMYGVGVVLAGSLQQADPGFALVVALALGAASGALSGTLVGGLRMAAFMATLALMFVWRALGLWLSDTQGLPVSPALADLARETWLGVPATLWLAAAVFAISAGLMTASPLGRWVRAVGEDREAARRAGVAVAAVVAATHVLCGLHAALAGVVMMAQVGFVTSAFGEGMEFLAVAAAALGGTRLLGGRGSLAGPVLGAWLLQAVQNGLVLSGADPYAYPLVTALCILAAVAVGTRREDGLAAAPLWRRPPGPAPSPIPPSPARHVAKEP